MTHPSAADSLLAPVATTPEEIIHAGMSFEEFAGGEPVTVELPAADQSISFDEFAGGKPVTVEPAPAPAADPSIGETITDALTSAMGFLMEPDAEGRPSFVMRTMQDIVGRAETFDKIDKLVSSGEQTLGEGLLQATGKVGAGAVLDVLGEGLTSGLELLSDVTPDEIEDPIVQGLASAGTAFLETDLGRDGLKAAQAGFASWNEFRANNPRAARNIEAVVDIGLLMAPVKVKPKISAKPTFADKLATNVTSSATAQTLRQKLDFVEALVRPKQTKKVREEEIRRTTEGGIIRGRDIELSASERSMADEVGKIEGVGSDKTLLQNLNTIADANRAEAEFLQAALKKNDVDIPESDIAVTLENAVQTLIDDPLLVGDAAKVAERLAQRMKVIASEHPATASGLLAARKEFDALVRESKRGAFDPNQENAISAAVREVRQSVNDLIDSRVTDVAVKDSLRKQSNLFRAIDNIAPKAADEAGNAALRLFQKVGRAIDMGATVKQAIVGGLALGTGGFVFGQALANAAPFALGAAGTIGLVLGGKKLATSALSKNALALLIRQADNAIRATTDKKLLAELKADRAAVAEIFKQLQSEKTENE